MPIHSLSAITTRQNSSISLKKNFNDIVSRAKARDAGIWSAFVHNKPGTDDDSWRMNIFGLYSTANDNHYVYLIEMSTDELSNLYTSFYYDLVQLDGEQTAFLTEMVTKEYMAEVDDAIVRNGFVTKQKKIDSDTEYYRVRLSVLEVDRDALETRRLEVETLKEKIQIEIENLRYQVDEAEFSKQEMEVEVARKQLAIKKENLRLTEISLEILEYQRRVNEAALRINELDVDRQKISTAMRKLDAVEANQEAKLIDLDSRIALLNVDLIQEGVKLVRIDHQSLTVDNELKKIDVELLRETVKQVRLANESVRISTDLVKGDARLAELDAEARRIEARSARLAADDIRLDAKSKKLDAVIKSLNVDIAREGVKLVRLASDEIGIQTDTEKLALIDTENDIEEKNLSSKKFQVESIYQAKIDMLTAELNAINPETDYYTQRLEKLSELIEARKREIFESFAASVTAVKNSWMEVNAGKDLEAMMNVERLSYQTGEEIPESKAMDAERLRIYDAQVKAGRYVGQSIVDRAYAMATAKIENTLTHVLGQSGS